MLHQHRTMPLALADGINPDQGQIPMRLAGVIAPHLFEERGGVLVIALRYGTLHQIKQRLFIGMNPGRQPKRCPGIFFDVVSAPMAVRAARERLDETWKVFEVLIRIAIHPPCGRIGAERQYQHGRDRIFFARCGDLDRPCCHGFPRCAPGASAAGKYARGHLHTTFDVRKHTIRTGLLPGGTCPTWSACPLFLRGFARSSLWSTGGQ